jgi:hypothetical protein
MFCFRQENLGRHLVFHSVHFLTSVQLCQVASICQLRPFTEEGIHARSGMGGDGIQPEQILEMGVRATCALLNSSIYSTIQTEFEMVLEQSEMCSDGLT